jgi:hypothetical protein
MTSSPDFKITRFSVAQLGNSQAVARDLRLKSENFGSQFSSARIDQGFLKTDPARTSMK